MSKRHKAKAMRFRIEKADEGEKDFTEAFMLMVELYKLNGEVPLDANEAAGQFYGALKQGATWIARKDGEAVGVLALVELPFWYNKAVTYLQDIGFYVKPEHRGAIGVALMRAAREEGIKRGKIVHITQTNPRKRPKGTTMSLEAQIAGFYPIGHTIKVH